MVAVSRWSRLRFCAYLTEAGVEFFDLPQYPDIPASDDDLHHEVIEGERLDTIAHRYYGEPLLWWVIARVNGLDNPEHLRVRQLLRVPSPRYVSGTLFSRAAGRT